MKTEDLILKPIRKTEDKMFEKYNGVLDIVFGKGLDADTNKYYFQRDAMRCVFDYMLEYKCLRDLIKEKIENGGEYNDYYQREGGIDYLENFADKDKKIATIDLPTGSGKSFVMFAAAIILYNETDDIKKIQIITPSNTISKQLREKFEKLLDKVSKMQDIKLPQMTSIHNEALADGQIAIDNIHKFYETENAQISKEHSFGNGQGANTLIINDEAHHIYNAEQSITAQGGKEDLRNWLKFLLSGDYKFNYIMNFTATPFENQKIYLHNVIYRYSLTQAIKNKVVKEIRYLPRGDVDVKGVDAEEQQLKFGIEQLKKIKENFKKKNLGIKPFGVVICEKIEKADDIVESMIKLGVNKTEVIAYTSKEEHLKNEELLHEVDNSDNPIEWVISVGMLTEGWDAKNVFVLVPQYEKAFNSKLLISQIVGRGLRRVEGIDDANNEVLILNHKSWGDTKVQMLINDVVDVSPRVEFGTTNKYHFEVDYLEKVYKDFDIKLQDNVADISFRKDVLGNAFDKFIEQKEKYRASILTTKLSTTNSGGSIDTQQDLSVLYKDKAEIGKWYETEILPMAEIKDKFDTKEEFVKYVFENEKIKASKVNDKLHNHNLRLIKEQVGIAFNGGDIKGCFKYELTTKNTKDMPIESVGVETFLIEHTSKHNSLWYSKELFDIGNGIRHKKFVVQTKLQFDDHMRELPSANQLAKEKVVGLFKNIDAEKYKTPLEVVRADSEPESIFIEHLFDSIDKVECWVKSTRQGFYTIDCGSVYFNPDFIIKMKDGNTLIVETKSDKDTSQVNKYKLKGLEEYLQNLNKEKKGGKKTYGYILTPSDFGQFFGEVFRKGNYNHKPNFHSLLNLD